MGELPADGRIPPLTMESRYESNCRRCRGVIRFGDPIEKVAQGTWAWAHHRCPTGMRKGNGALPISIRTLHADIHHRMSAYLGNGGPLPDLLREHAEIVERMREMGIDTARPGKGHPFDLCDYWDSEPIVEPARAPSEIVHSLANRHGSVHHAIRLSLNYCGPPETLDALRREHAAIIDQMHEAGIDVDCGRDREIVVPRSDENEDGQARNPS